MIFIIDDILVEMALENKSHFSPHYVCDRANLNDIKSVTEYLLQLVGSKLTVNYEVECPEGDSDFAVTSPLELSSKPKMCHICGTTYTPSLDRIWVSFDFTPEYLQYVKKEKKQLKTIPNVSANKPVIQTKF